MRKILLYFMMLLVLCGCATKQLTGVVTDKRFTQAWIETVGPGYRYDCGVTMEGKFECGVKYFVTSKTIYHPAEYYLTVQSDSCVFETSVPQESYNSLHKGDYVTVEVWEDTCQG